MDTGNINKTIAVSLAKIITIVFHPLLMPVYCLAIILTTPELLPGYFPAYVKKILFLLVLMNNVVLPVILLPLFRNINLIHSYTIDERDERIAPLIAVSILYSVTTYIVFRFHLPALLKSFIFASTILVIAVTIINLWWKISIHAVSAGALVAVVFVLSLEMNSTLIWYLISSILIGGFVLSSRLKLNSHNPMQVWTGFITGLFGLVLLILLI
jgi:hypothetical protein